MKKSISLSLPIIAILGTSTALAGGLDRSGQNISALFEEGRAIGFSAGMVSPDVSGEAYSQDAKDVIGDYTTFGLSYKADFNTQFSYALIFDQPYGASVEYPDNASPVVAGANASVSSNAITILGRYKINNRFSIYGGPRIQQLEGQYEVPTFGVAASVPEPARGYSLKADTATEIGYSLGMAYEIPDYALRVALTYHSAIDYELDATESVTPRGVKDAKSKLKVTMPQAVNLDFQTGINEKTLVFGSIRWAEWSEFDLTPEAYSAINLGAGALGSIIDLKKDTVSYNLGVGRKITDVWSIAGSIGYEAATDEEISLLAPTDGQTSFGLAAIYDNDDIRLTVGARYAWLGDADGSATLGPVTVNHDFKDNTALGFGISFLKRF